MEDRKEVFPPQKKNFLRILAFFAKNQYIPIDGLTRLT